MIYIEYIFTVAPLQPFTGILIAELGGVGFESFVETSDGVKAYIQKEEWNPQLLADIFILKSDEVQISFKQAEIEQQNWNAKWEENFNPIVVDGRCTVKAPFHTDTPDTEYTIIIEPKMSFGTGHHATTHMILSFLLEDEVDGQTVLDMGCGTSVLAIMAAKRGAGFVEAIDIDPWCYENSLENVERNGRADIVVKQGDASILGDKKFDTIIANINRNILLNDLPAYHAVLQPGGTLYLSGYLEADREILEEACTKLGGTAVKYKSREGWIAAKFVF
ncbi:50S ribosomal protein L11 methyltransferase [Gilvibacter sp.]|uniref:50S ribosomal protein L11 methyltransferase n=1 Tax=Gilvibacter sp. TaxID=2729997 RepID=UPI0025B96168|nr:50S ribosomal protein L11 methyltransferase [Gilvibacter sp.]NQX77942.1 50S ribosomal protein L11 methyltransferase [Gilvibacter sp.]